MTLFAQAPPLIQQAPDDTGTRRSSLVQSILAALIYGDLFDYPLSLGEIVRYQVGTNFSPEDIRRAITSDPQLTDTVIKEQGFYALRGRSDVFALRRQRVAHSSLLWPRAKVYGRLASTLPFVRAVAVTGALAVNNLGARPDIDLMIVAAEGRVWLCRRALIALVRLARLLGDDLCPNYIISENRLELGQRDFFTAHELAQMVLLAGGVHYRHMIMSNRWAARFLPNAFTRELRRVRPSSSPAIKRGIEAILSLAPFDKWERWELTRMRRRLRPLVGQVAEVVCSPEQCKGHTGLHRQSVLTRYTDALSAWGLRESLKVVSQQSEQTQS